MRHTVSNKRTVLSAFERFMKITQFHRHINKHGFSRGFRKLWSSSGDLSNSFISNVEVCTLSSSSLKYIKVNSIIETDSVNVKQI